MPHTICTLPLLVPLSEAGTPYAFFCAVGPRLLDATRACSRSCAAATAPPPLAVAAAGEAEAEAEATRGLRRTAYSIVPRSAAGTGGGRAPGAAHGHGTSSASPVGVRRARAVLAPSWRSHSVALATAEASAATMRRSCSLLRCWR